MNENDKKNDILMLQLVLKECLTLLQSYHHTPYSKRNNQFLGNFYSKL